MATNAYDDHRTHMEWKCHHLTCLTVFSKSEAQLFILFTEQYLIWGEVSHMMWGKLHVWHLVRKLSSMVMISRYHQEHYRLKLMPKQNGHHFVEYISGVLCQEQSLWAGTSNVGCIYSSLPLIQASATTLLIFKCVLLNDNYSILIKISLNFVP